jgi:phytoene dehydrogenase-like protein
MVEGLDAGLLARARATSPSYFGTIMVHAALSEAPRWKAGDIVNQCSQVDLIDSTDFEDFRHMYDGPRWGVVSDRFCTGVPLATNHDPTRAPQGKHIISSYSFVPYSLKDGGAKRWDEIKAAYGEWTLRKIGEYAPNVSGKNILGHAVESPLDLERYSVSYTGGDVGGLAASLHQMMGMRPTPELSQYRVPGAKGLYLTGPFMHPGGGIGGGGRAVAIRMMEDLKIGYDKVIRV